MLVIFVGGSKDKQTTYLSELKKELIFNIYDKEKLKLGIQTEPDRIETYRMMSIAGIAVEIIIYVYSELTFDEALQKVFNSYAK